MEKAATTQSLGFGVKGTGVLGNNGRLSWLRGLMGLDCGEQVDLPSPRRSKYLFGFLLSGIGLQRL